MADDAPELSSGARLDDEVPRRHRRAHASGPSRSAPRGYRDRRRARARRGFFVAMGSSREDALPFARLSVDDATASPGAIIHEASATRLPHPSPVVPRPYRGASFAPHASVPCSACGAVAVQRADASCQTDPGDLTPLGRASPDAPGVVPSRDVLHHDDATTRRARGAPSPPPARARGPAAPGTPPSSPPSPSPPSRRGLPDAPGAPRALAPRPPGATEAKLPRRRR